MKYLIFLLSCSTYLWGQAPVDSLTTAADASYSNQNYEAAYNLYSELIEQDSTAIDAYEKAALSAFKLGDIPTARTLFITLEQKDSTNKVALTTLAGIYEFSKNAPKAILYYHKLAKAFPSNAVNFRKLAQQYQQAGLKKDAHKCYTQALVLNNKDQFTIRGLAELELRAKNYSQADSLLHMALQRDSSNISLNLLIAQSKYLQKAYDSTAYYMEVIIGKHDFRPHQNKMLGYAYIQIDSLERAITYLTRAINDPGTKEYAHYHLGGAYEKLGNTDYALHHYEEAVEASISEDIDLYHRNVARLYSRKEDLKSAIPHYQDAYKYGEDPIILFYLARAADNYYKDKNIAIRYYSKFIESQYQHNEYQEYAVQRKRYLKEMIHQQK